MSNSILSIQGVRWAVAASRRSASAYRVEKTKVFKYFLFFFVLVFLFLRFLFVAHVQASV